MKISVIIPAYNCEKLISDTIKSLQAQTLSDYELIVINDGSTDGTLEILEKLQKAEGRIKLITVKNAGPANARNVGIKAASGEYLYFMDADDLIDSDMLFEMYKMASENSLDVVCCGFNMENISTPSPQIKKFSFPTFLAEDRDAFRFKLMDMIKAHVMYVVWNKLYSAEFIKQNAILFPHFFSGEDRIFNISTFAKINRFGFIDKPYYRYFLRGQQTLANRYVENRFEAALKCHGAFIESYKQMGLYDDKNRGYIDFAFVKMIISCFTQLNSRGCKMNFSQKKKYIADILSNEYVKAAIIAKDDQFGYSKIINSILKSNNKTLVYLTSKGIFIMQFKLNSLYLKLKHRVKK